MVNQMKDDATDFIARMARMSLPEEECPEGVEVDDYIADLDDEHLCGEYSTFMEMVRTARRIMQQETAT